MSDLLTAAVILGGALMVVLLFAVLLIGATHIADTRDVRRQQALRREAELKEIEEAPAVTFDDILNSAAIPADIREQFVERKQHHWDWQ